ncbi:MAG TPA: methyl-accepting chemotaxis protein [Acidobacteriaceae bacterium]|jgi:methyl-accepting chemotaxis protein|nr:methyl-accepting chemotaxis protein [Acidobacteriaceae bacterium]
MTFAERCSSRSLSCRSLSCRSKLRLVSGLLIGSTMVAGLTVLVRFSPAVTAVLWAIAVLGGVTAIALLNLAGRNMVRSIEQLAERARALAAGDLTGDVAALSGCSQTDETGELARAIAALQQTLDSAVATTLDTSRALETDAENLSRAGAQAWDRTARQSQQTHQAASAMQEMSISIAEVSGHAQNASDSARQAASIAREGGAIVEEVLSGMNTISASVTETASTVERLGKQSEQIIRIVNVIEEIAEKTNLLALNAAIEAARAGEQGRGFAVVAGEVRRLAESTRSATSEIAETIDSITRNTREAVRAMGSGTERVGRGMEITGRAADSLQRIIAAADRVEAMIAQIATASTEQSVAAQEFSRNLEVINRLGEEHAAATPVTRACVASVHSDALRLQEAMRHFRLGAGPAVLRAQPPQPELRATTPQPVAGD